MIYDINSSPTWVYWKEACALFAQNTCPARNKSYSSKASSTFSAVGDNLNWWTYSSTREVGGYVVSDKICTDSAGRCYPGFAGNTEFVAASYQHDLAALNIDGMVGLAPLRHKNDDPKSPIQLRKESNNNPLFSFFFNQDETSGGKLLIGSIDLKNYAAGG